MLLHDYFLSLFTEAAKPDLSLSSTDQPVSMPLATLKSQKLTEQKVKEEVCQLQQKLNAFVTKLWIIMGLTTTATCYLHGFGCVYTTCILCLCTGSDGIQHCRIKLFHPHTQMDVYF